MIAVSSHNTIFLMITHKSVNPKSTDQHRYETEIRMLLMEKDPSQLGYVNMIVRRLTFSLCFRGLYLCYFVVIFHI